MPMGKHLAALAVLFVGFASLDAADTVKLRTLAGKTVEGELISINEKEIVVRGKDGPISTLALEVLDIDLPTSAATGEAKFSDVELVDGSLLHVSKFSLKGNQIELKLLGGADVKLPLAAISYLLNDAQDAKTREEWQGFLATRGNQDLLAVKDPTGKVNPLPGTFGSGDDAGETIEFDPTGAPKRQLKLARIHAMSFWRKRDPDAPSAVCRVHDAAKNMLAASKVAFDENGFSVTTAAGVEVKYPRGMVARVDYSQGKLAYLSDLEPKVIERSDLEWIDHYRRDRGLDGGPLRIAKDSYTKGLALHAYTELIYDIGGQYKELKTVVGADPKIGGDSDAKLMIEADGQKLFTADITRKTEPRAITLDVRNVKLLRIVVSSNRLLGLGDHVNLADAKVSK